jgi:hypothetical protein
MSTPHDVEHQHEIRTKALLDRDVTRRDLFRYGGLLGFGTVGAGMLASCTPLASDLLRQTSSPDDPPPAQAKYLVVVIVDGCRADYVSPGAHIHAVKEPLHLPTLEGMMRSGTHYTNAWSGSMESITPACHASIGTGRFARNNGGILGFWWENPDDGSYGEHVDLTNSRSPGAVGNNVAVDPTSLEQILQANHVPTMATFLKDVDPTAKVYAGAGAKFYAADAAGGADADFITYLWNNGPNYYRGVNVGGSNHTPLPDDLLASVHAEDYTTSNYGELNKAGTHLLLGRDGKPFYLPHIGESDTMVVELANKVIRRERPRIVILNLGDMDWPYGHLNGGILSPEYWTKVVTNADAALGRLMDTYRELGIFDETAFMFVGDHGMVALEQQVEKDLVKELVTQAGGVIAGADFHTGGFIWLTNPDQAYKVAALLDDNIYGDNLLAVTGVYFRGEVGGKPQFLSSPNTVRSLSPATDYAHRYLLETLNGANAPHVVLTFQERTGILGAGGTQQWYGDHGGASWSSHWVPLIMSGPGIRKDYVSKYPARLVDLAPTGLRLLGVPYRDMDGVVLADALDRAARSELGSQNAMSRLLVPIVAAMKRQASIDVAYIRNHVPVNPPPGSADVPQGNSLRQHY